MFSDGCVTRRFVVRIQEYYGLINFKSHNDSFCFFYRSKICARKLELFRDELL